jgi:hypothetical protein
MSTTLSSADETAHTTERSATKVLIFVAVVLHSVALMNAAPLQSANDRSRWCTVWSLVERGTFQIDEIRQVPGWDSIDIIYDDGHFYSTKPPLLTIIVAGVTWCVQKATGWSLLDNVHSVTTVVLFIVNIVPFAISLVLLSRLLQRVARTMWCRLFVLSAAGFGTLATPFLMTLNNHTVAVAGVIFSLYALERILSAETPSGCAFALCGAAAGWVCANELPAAAFGLATFVLALRRSTRQTICWYAPAALIPIGAFLATNVIATGSWKPTYASFGSPKYNFVIDGVPSYWMDPDGVDRNLDSPAVYLLHCTIGHHGIFSLTPIYLLMLASWFSSGAIQNTALRMIVRLGAFLTVLVVGFYLTRFDNYNYGGVSCGLRWALWLIPFWLLSVVPIIDTVFRFKILRCGVLALLALSMVSAWLPIENPWQQPWLFRQMEACKWIDYTRKPVPLPRKLWTWFQSIPDGTQTQEPTWLELTSQTADGTLIRRRLVIHPTANSGIVELEVLDAEGDQSLQSTRRLLLNWQRFDEGVSTADFVTWPDAETPTAQKMSDLTFLRGLPLKKEYRPGRTRYLHLPLRQDAFRCQLAAAAVDYPQENPTHQYRCETWLCDELPFGVAQYDLRVTDIATGAVVHQERWTVSACSPRAAAAAPPL